jgi:hypothetical protein
LGVTVTYKDQHWYWRALGWLVMAVTFGQVKDFVDGSTTTIGKTIALPRAAEKWNDISMLETFTHELVHVNQFKRFTPVVFGFLYLFCFFPLGLAYFRYWAERQAYVAGFEVLVRAYGEGVRPGLVAFATQEMIGPDYGWAWPFRASVTKYFEDNIPHAS